MKLEIKITPIDMNEATKILAALTGAGLNIEKEPTIVTESLVNNLGATENSVALTPGEKLPIKTTTLVPELDGTEESVVGVAAVQLEDLKTGTERDSAGRLWCADINTSNKGKRADETFKRAPKLEDSYYDEVIALLDTEAKEFKEEAGKPVSTVEENSQVTQQVEQVATSVVNQDTVAVVAPAVEPAPAPVIEEAVIVPPAPAPVAPAPTPVREIVGYRYSDNQYTKEQLLSFEGWTEELIEDNCTPVYAEPAPVVSGVTLDQVKMRIQTFASRHQLAPQCMELVKVAGGTTLNDIPEAKLGLFNTWLNTIEANLEAVKSGAMTLEQIHGGAPVPKEPAEEEPTVTFRANY